LAARERRVVVPFLLAFPVLFLAGAIFCYLVVLPPAIRFLQGINSESFQTLVQARDYYRFTLMLMGAMGLLFQIPIAVVAANRAGIVSVRQLRRGRRYALFAIAVIAMLMPGQDPVTMLLMMAPMYVLYEASVLTTAILSRRS
jgi:sec-independent protein translocase protein TatC